MEKSVQSDESSELVDLTEPTSKQTNVEEEKARESYEDKISVQSDKSEYETGSE